MPKGVPEDGMWRGLEPLDAWVRRTQPSAPLCACGCGERIRIQRHHRAKGIPVFVRGHHARVEHGRYLGVDRWVEEQQGKHLCACGCGGAITIIAQHHATGIPRYLPAHHTPPRLGHGPGHPNYIHDRSLVKARNGQGFTPWTMSLIRKRCDGACVECGATENLECDHIEPIALGGTGEPENGQLLCHNCHRAKTRVEWLRAGLLQQCDMMFETIDDLLAGTAAVAA